MPQLLLAHPHAVHCAGTGGAGAGGGASSVLVQQQQEQIQQVGALLRQSPAFPQLAGKSLHIADHAVCLCYTAVANHRSTPGGPGSRPQATAGSTG